MGLFHEWARCCSILSTPLNPALNTLAFCSYCFEYIATLRFNKGLVHIRGIFASFNLHFVLVFKVMRTFYILPGWSVLMTVVFFVFEIPLSVVSSGPALVDYDWHH